MASASTVRYVLHSKANGYYAEYQPTYEYCYTDKLEKALQWRTMEGTLKQKRLMPRDTVIRKLTTTLFEENVDETVTFAKERAEYKKLVAEAKSIGLDAMEEKRFKRMRRLERMFGWERYRPPVTVEGPTPTRDGVRAILEKKYGT